MSKIEIAGEDLKFTPLPDPLPEPITGELIAKAAGADEPKNYLVFQWLSNGQLESLRLDEKAVQDGSSIRRFVLFRGASTFLLEIDGQRFEWGSARIQGEVLKKLVGIDSTQFGVWRQNNDGDDVPIENEKFVDLSSAGLEQFFTAKRESTEGATK